MSAGGKKLGDLRVCDLKDELERRSLETGGNKIALVERLQKALKDEGKDPETYIFEAPGKRTPSKKTTVKIKTEEPEEKSADDSVDGDVVIVDEVGMVDEDEIHTVDADNNDNEESINLTIEEEEQNLLHQQAQDGKDDSKKSGDADSSNCNNNDVITIKKEKEDEPECEESVPENADADDATKNGDANADGEAEESAEGEHKKDDSDQSSAAKTSTGKDEKDKAAAGAASLKKSTASSSRNLWVSGLSSLTRASDLKTIFSKYGKVIGAKVVTNTRTPGTRCYGYVTMASSADASRCIEHLHHAELHGRIISVERTKSEIGSSGAVAAKKDDNAKPANENGEPNTESGKDGAKEVKKAADKAVSVDRKKSEARSRKSSRARSDRKTVRSNSRTRQRSPPRRMRRSVERERERKRDVLSFQKIREERERQRMRERERELREEERRRRDFRRRQREEEERLAREREKLRMERERLEREKAELLRLERERQKLEREKIELERLELKRQQMKILQRNEESKRSIKRPAPEDRYASSGGHTESKRSNTDRRFEAPPPPRFDSSITRSADKKRDDYSSSKREDYKRDLDSSSTRHTSSNYHSSRDTHKESRYAVPDPPRSSFRRDERDSRNSGSKRFDGPSYGERSSGGGGSSSNWHNSGPPAIKSFAVSQMSNNVPSWQSKSSETSNNHWPSQDRYDRTYNERSGPYMDPSSRQSGMFVGSGSGRPQDRYGGQISRYENGKY